MSECCRGLAPRSECRCHAEEDETHAWEYWHQRAHNLEVENYRLREALRAAEQAIDDCHSFRKHHHFAELKLVRDALGSALTGGQETGAV